MNISTQVINILIDLIDLKKRMNSLLRLMTAVMLPVCMGPALPAYAEEAGSTAPTENIYRFEDGDHVVKVNGKMTFYDDGGPDGKYTSASSGTVTFVPGADNEIIRMRVRSFWTNYQDHFYVYDGSSIAEGAVPAADLSGSKSDVPDIISKADDGSLTVKFEPKKNKINNGWEIEVESFVPQMMGVSAVEVTQVNDVKMLRGSMANKLLKMAVTVTGDKGTVDLSWFSFDLLDSDTEAVSAANVWCTGTVDEFDTASPYGQTLTAAPLDFQGEAIYDRAGTYYYWLTYDISPDAATDSKVQARLLSIQAADGTAVSPAEVKSVLTTVQDGMHGTFSVGTSGDCDFLSIGKAVEALAQGIDGPVVFELEDGNYNELVSIPPVTGSSPRNTITFRSASGKRENVTISYDTYRDPGSSNYDKRYGVVTFDGVDHCTLQDLTVTTDAANFPGLVFWRNASDHDTLLNCVVRAATSKDVAKGSSLVYMYAKNEANRNNNHMTIRDCLLDGGYIGVNMVGTSYVALPKQRGGTVTGCTLRNQGGKGIFISCEEDATVTGNTFISDGDTYSSYNCLDISDPGGDLTVAGNTMRVDKPANSVVALYVRGYSMDKVKKGFRRFYNNEVNMTNVSGPATAIRVNNDIQGMDFVFNTVRMGGTGNATTVYMAAGMPGGRLAANIIQNETDGKVFHVQRETYLQDLAFADNTMFCSNEKFAYIGADKTYDEWAEATGQTGSYLEKTDFLSDNVLEPASEGHLSMTSPVDYVHCDLYGAERSASAPTRGAYEYAVSTEAPAFAEGYPDIASVSHRSAEIKVKGLLTGKMHHVVIPASEPAPEVSAVMSEDLETELKKGVEETLRVDGLEPNTAYRFYAVLGSLRGLESEVLSSETFTTTYEPTRTATFEEAVEDGARLLDGTMSFTGFSLADIEDGVAPAPNAKAASMDDDYAVIQLLNATDLTIEGFFMKNNASVTLSTKDSALKPLKSKTVEPSATWTYVDLLPMGGFTYLELESEGDVLIDNFGGAPLELLVSVEHDEGTPVKGGEAMSLTAVTDGGVPPFRFSWTDALRQEAGQAQALSLVPEVSGTYTVAVTDARDNRASATVKVRVLGEQKTATFDDLWLESDSHWCGDTEDEDYVNGSFFSGSFEFNNLYMADWDSWAFFGYANHPSTSFSSYVTDQWNSATGHGVEGTGNYGILYVSPFMGKSVMTLSNTDSGEAIPGMYVTNSAWVVDAILKGDGMEDRFAEGDMLSLTITGIKADGTSAVMEIPLADYRAENDADRWYLDSWQWVDLSPLGEVKSVEWAMSSTKANSHGMTTPSYVCLDNIGAPRPVRDGEPVSLKVNEEEPEASFELEPYFSFKADEGTVAYDIECDPDKASLADGKVSVSALPGETLDIVAQALQRGKHEWVRIPVTMERKPLGISATEISGVAIYPNPADSYVTVNADTDSYSVDIVSMDGRLLMSAHGLSGKQTLNVGVLESGNYLLRLTAADGLKAVRKLLVKH